MTPSVSGLAGGHRARPTWHNRALRLARLRERRASYSLGLLLALFLALSFLAHSTELLSLDQTITRTLQTARGGWTDRVAVLFTSAGDAWTLVVVAIAGALVLFRSRRPRAALLCLVTLAGLPLNVLIKSMVGRVRPTSDLVEVILPAVGLSYPSGHAMAAVMVYGFLSLMAWIHLSRPGPRRFWAAAFAALAAGISLSRIYLGAHWCSDVLGGWAAGLFLLLLLAEGYKAVAGAELAPTAPTPPEEPA